MIRALFLLVVAGLVGMMVLGVVFSLVLPLAGVAIKLLLVLLVGYLILRLVRPDLADDIRTRLRGDGV